MKIFLKTLSSKQSELEIEPTDTILEMKKKIETQYGHPYDLVNLVFAGKPLVDTQTVTEANLSDGAIVIMFVKGGKKERTPVSLPRATPKEPQPSPSEIVKEPAEAAPPQSAPSTSQPPPSQPPQQPDTPAQPSTDNISPDPEKLALLIGMGFSEPLSRQMLILAENDIDKATNLLMSDDGPLDIVDPALIPPEPDAPIESSSQPWDEIDPSVIDNMTAEELRELNELQRQSRLQQRQRQAPVPAPVQPSGVGSMINLIPPDLAQTSSIPTQSPAAVTPQRGGIAVAPPGTLLEWVQKHPQLAEIRELCQDPQVFIRVLSEIITQHRSIQEYFIHGPVPLLETLLGFTIDDPRFTPYATVLSQQMFRRSVGRGMDGDLDDFDVLDDDDDLFEEEDDFDGADEQVFGVPIVDEPVEPVAPVEPVEPQPPPAPPRQDRYERAEPRVRRGIQPNLLHHPNPNSQRRRPPAYTRFQYPTLGPLPNPNPIILPQGPINGEEPRPRPQLRPYLRGFNSAMGGMTPLGAGGMGPLGVGGPGTQPGMAGVGGQAPYPPGQSMGGLYPLGMGAGSGMGGLGYPPGPMSVSFSDEDLQNLQVIMEQTGATQEQAVYAYIVCERNVDQAVNFLLDGG